MAFRRVARLIVSRWSIARVHRLFTFVKWSWYDVSIGRRRPTKTGHVCAYADGMPSTAGLGATRGHLPRTPCIADTTF